MWYNKLTGQCQTIPPWGTGQIHPELIKELYPDWELVDENFTPPPIPLSKVQQYEAVNNRYAADELKLLAAIQSADARSLPATVKVLKDKVVSNEVKRKAEILFISNN